MGDSLRTDANRSRMVFRLWPFFERVVAHDERAAIWDFDQIAGCTFRAVGDCAANHFGAQCPRFDRMTLPGVGEMRILDAQQIDVFDIDRVCASPYAGAVPVKVTVADRDRGSRHTTEKTVLIVDKLDSVDCQTALDQANTRSVIVRHAGACQG